MAFEIKNLKKTVKQLEGEFRGYSGFLKFLTENIQVENDMNIEGVSQGHWNKKFST